jgi:ATP-dependent RNA helicase DDX31/DBP7
MKWKISLILFIISIIIFKSLSENLRVIKRTLQLWWLNCLRQATNHHNINNLLLNNRIFFFFSSTPMELNFAVEVDSVKKLNVTKVTNNLKKGSWKKKRMDAKKIVQRVKKETRQEILQVLPTEEFKRKTKGNVVRADAVKKGFTSSIFTANPAPQKASIASVKPAKHITTPAPNVAIVPVTKLLYSNESLSKPKPIAPKPAVPKEIIKEPIVLSDSTFQGLGLHPVLSTHLQKLKVTEPTPIQKQSIPTIRDTITKDIIIQAETGSGKTFSFLLPILHHLITAASLKENEHFSRQTGTFACILVPTRELAQQITTVLESLLSYTRSSDQNECKHWIVSGIITGGESKKSEKARLRKGMNIVVATPGRLLDHMKTTESFDLGNLRWLVLDEADNLLHLGFEETLREILQILNEKGNQAVANGNRLKIRGWPFQRQTILCSATIEGGVEKLAQESLRDPLFIKAKTDSTETETEADSKKVDSGISIPSQLEQFYVLSPAKLRLVSLLGLLRKINDSGQKNAKVIIFLATGDSVDWHFDAFNRINEAPDRDVVETNLDFDVNEEVKPAIYGDLAKLRQGYESSLLPNCRLFKLHGSLLQSERHAVFTGFSPEHKGCTKILFCTDVAARI